jgi:hypothetical protein
VSLIWFVVRQLYIPPLVCPAFAVLEEQGRMYLQLTISAGDFFKMWATECHIPFWGWFKKHL